MIREIFSPDREERPVAVDAANNACIVVAPSDEFTDFSINSVDLEVAAIAERTVLEFMSPKSKSTLCHTTRLSMSSTEVENNLHTILTAGLSHFGCEGVLHGLESGPVPFNEITPRQNAVNELAANPNLKKAILEFGETLHRIHYYQEFDVVGKQGDLSHLTSLSEVIRAQAADPLLVNLCDRLHQYVSQDVVREFIGIDFTKDFAPNRFSKIPNAKVRINPIHNAEAWLCTLFYGFITSISVASNSMPAAMNATLVAIGIGAVALASRETHYNEKSKELKENFRSALFSSKMYSETVAAVRALEELCAYGNLTSLNGAVMPTVVKDGDLISVTDMTDPIAARSKRLTVPVSVEVRKGKPLLMTGQNGGGKTYTCGTLVRNYTSALRGGPVFAHEATLSYIDFFAMQAPKQQAAGNHGRLGSEANTTSYLLQRAEKASEGALLIFDEVGQGTSREGTEEATRRALGEAAACGLFVIHPTHELPIARRLFNSGLVDAIQVSKSGVMISHGFELGVAPKSGADLIAKKIGYNEKATRNRVKKAHGDVELFNRWSSIGNRFEKENESKLDS